MPIQQDIYNEGFNPPMASEGLLPGAQNPMIWETQNFASDPNVAASDPNANPFDDYCRNNPNDPSCQGNQSPTTPGGLPPEWGDCPPWAPGCHQGGDYNPCSPGYERGPDGFCHPIGQGTTNPFNDFCNQYPNDPGCQGNPPLPQPPTGGGGGGIPPVGDSQPPYDTTLPPVDPYDVSQSRDWMNIFDYGGENANVNAINPQARPMAYDDINQFSDAAWQNSMRYLEPQMELQDERFAQELINKGIDPNSEAGQRAFRQKQMGQSDLLSKSAFDAMGFGTGIQEQMFGQDAVRSQLANAMLQSQMGLAQRGHEFDVTAGMSADDQAFAQMMGLEGLNYRDYLTGVDQQRYQDSLALALAGLAPAPNYQTFNTGLPQAPIYEYQGGSDYFANLFGGQ